MENDWESKNMTLEKYCWFLAFHHLKPWKDSRQTKGCSFIDHEHIPWTEIEIKTKANKDKVAEEHMSRSTWGI
jgi:hypothetical protein